MMTSKPNPSGSRQTHRLLLATLFMVRSAWAETPVAEHELDWTGFYAGLSAGAILNESDLKANHVGLVKNPMHDNIQFTSFIPGAQAGYLKHFSNGWAAGVEIDFTYPDSEGHADVSCGSCPGTVDHFTVKNRIQGALLGRVGHPFHHDQWFPYLTAGVSFADTSLGYTNDVGDRYVKNTAQTGWVLGTGLEYRPMQPLSVRAEYLYTDYGDALNMNLPVIDGTEDPAGHAEADLASHTFRMALNYWF
jgi:outer membrane immunogenic protein